MKGSADSFALRNHGAKSMLPRVYPEKSFPPEYVMKDLSYVLELAAELNVALNTGHGLTAPACATNAISAANQFLATVGYTGVHPYPASTDAQATVLHIPLDNFNNGSLTC